MMRSLPLHQYTYVIGVFREEMCMYLALHRRISSAHAYSTSLGPAAPGWLRVGADFVREGQQVWWGAAPLMERLSSWPYHCEYRRAICIVPIASLER